MKKIEIKTYSSPMSLIYSIVYLILGVILFTNPNETASFISYVFGSILIVISVIKFTWIYFSRKYQEKGNKWDFFIAIATLLIGLACLFFYQYIEKAIRFIIGSWILFVGINRLINALKYIKERVFWSLFIVSLLLSGCGIFVIFYSNLLIKGIGLVLIVFSVLEIIGYIFFSQTKPEVIAIKEAEYEEVEQKKIKEKN